MHKATQTAIVEAAGACGYLVDFQESEAPGKFRCALYLNADDKAVLPIHGFEAWTDITLAERVLSFLTTIES